MTVVSLAPPAVGELLDDPHSELALCLVGNARNVHGDDEEFLVQFGGEADDVICHAPEIHYREVDQLAGYQPRVLEHGRRIERLLERSASQAGRTAVAAQGEAENG